MYRIHRSRYYYIYEPNTLYPKVMGKIRNARFSHINKICSEPSKLTDGKLYTEIVGSLIYAMTATGPDLCFIVTNLLEA